jgi:aspartate-semialdehyde dehydrogenase
MSKEKNVAVVGATGAVGMEMLKVLEERRFPVKDIRLFASTRSKGKKLKFKGRDIKVEELSRSGFRGIEIALFSAGASRSLEFAPKFVRVKAVVIDNSSAFRMEKNVPLVVPEVNPHAIKKHRGIIANPNCSTIQMVVALNPIHKKYRIKRIVAVTYQSVSGTGLKAMDELMRQTKDILGGHKIIKDVYPHQIAFNCLPQVDAFLENDYTKEEMKTINETRKILEDGSIKITATCVRVPVFRSHSEAVNIETEKKVSAAEAQELLRKAPGVALVDNPEENLYPLAVLAAGRDEVFVGRIRKDESVPSGLNLWIVSDNLRKGAALNAVQIAEYLL